MDNITWVKFIWDLDNLPACIEAPKMNVEFEITEKDSLADSKLYPLFNSERIVDVVYSGNHQ